MFCENGLRYAVAVFDEVIFFAEVYEEDEDFAAIV
jgi:hypothetical protein